MHTSNALDPQSPQARAIYDLGIVSTIIFVLIFVVVAAGIVYAIFRFRGREGEPEPKQFTGSEKVEIIWTVIPFLIVVFLFVLTLRAMNLVDPPLSHELQTVRGTESYNMISLTFKCPQTDQGLSVFNDGQLPSLQGRDACAIEGKKLSGRARPA